MAKKGKKLFSFVSFDNELSCTTRQSFEKLITLRYRISVHARLFILGQNVTLHALI